MGPLAIAIVVAWLAGAAVTFFFWNALNDLLGPYPGFGLIRGVLFSLAWPVSVPTWFLWFYWR